MATKRCSRCRLEKDNTEYYKAKARRIRREILVLDHSRIREYLRTHPCVDCGETEPVVLQFDHVRGQ